jgi:hypothetical protein
MGGGKQEKVVTPPPTAEETEVQKKSAALTDFQAQEAGLELVKGEDGSYSYKKRALTAEEQQHHDRMVELEDLAYKKMTGTISPEDRALVEQEYGAAAATGKSNIQSEFQRALGELNIGSQRGFQDIQTELQRGTEDINRTSRQSAAARGLNLGDTPIQNETQRNFQRFGEDVNKTSSRLQEDVNTNKRLLGEDLNRNVTNLETNLQGAKAGAMLDVGQRQQMFGQAITQFQSQLQQQAVLNRATIQQAFQNTSMGLGQLRTSGNRTVNTTGGQSPFTGALIGGAGGALSGFAAGAAAGSVVPGWGTLIGGIGGAVMGAASSRRT